MTAAIRQDDRPTAPPVGRSLPLFGGTYPPSGAPNAPNLEDPDYLCRQLITYIGNKRALLVPIGQAVQAVKRRLSKKKLRAFDVFSGSGVVSRYLKAHASYLATNDIEDYATVISQCYLRNRTTLDFAKLAETIDELNARVESERLPRGFIEELYAPDDEDAIASNDRVFYTIRKCPTARQLQALDKRGSA